MILIIIFNYNYDDNRIFWQMEAGIKVKWEGYSFGSNNLANVEAIDVAVNFVRRVSIPNQIR